MAFKVGSDFNDNLTGRSLTESHFHDILPMGLRNSFKGSPGLLK